MCTTEQGSSQDPVVAFRRSGESLFNQVQTYLKSTNPTGQNPNAGNTDQAGTTGEKKKNKKKKQKQIWTLQHGGSLLQDRVKERGTVYINTHQVRGVRLMTRETQVMLIELINRHRQNTGSQTVVIFKVTPTCTGG